MRPNIYGQLRRFPSAGGFLLTISIIVFATAGPVRALYEDQVGKSDWREQYVGAIRDGAFYGPSPDQVVVATEENVLAALNAKTGSILWRKVLEKGDRGSIRLLHVPNNWVRSGETDEELITVSGSSPALIRGWNARTGNIEWEWTLTPTTPQAAANAIWFYDTLYLYHVVPVFGSHLELTAYFASTGQQVKSTTTRIAATWISEDSCVLASTVYACVVKGQVIGVDLIAESNELLSKPLSGDYGGTKPVALKGADATIVLGEDIYALRADATVVSIKAKSVGIFHEKLANKQLLVQAILSQSNLQLISANAETGQSSADITAQLPFAELGAPRIIDVLCKAKSDGSIPACRVLLSTEDGAIVLVHQGKIKWTRQEALARIVAIEMIDLPLSDSEGSIENELKNKDVDEESSLQWDIFGALARRLTGQVWHLRNVFLTVLGLGAPQSDSQRAGLVRDSFGLHKMLVVATESGKIFGIDNQSGKHHWVKLLPNFAGFNNDQGIKIVVQRTSGHFPLLAQCSIVARNKLNGNGILYQFNPISGQPVSGHGIIELPYAIEQMAQLHDTRVDFLRGILFLDKQHRAHVVPKEDSSLAHGFYLYSADKQTGLISGYFVEFASNNLAARLVWQLNLSGADKSQRILRVATKNHIEHVHSQGRVFNDRSVLYKYINPNLVAVATIGPDAVHKYILHVHLIDVVSGSIVYSMAHRRVREPVHIVHSENWLVYSYYNDKVRRTEITTVELYEGKTQANSTVWSSLDAPQLPMVERQSYILPANVVHLKETITEKGITNKHVLVALSSGSVVEMPWVLLDPRRPILLPNQPREEGIIPYIPELQLPSENVINYNQSVVNVRGIHAAPSGLESTCIVVVYGLDVFVTRVAPSKTFDLLKEDFDYMLISIVLVALSLASVAVKHLSARKAIKQAWK